MLIRRICVNILITLECFKRMFTHEHETIQSEYNAGPTPYSADLHLKTAIKKDTRVMFIEYLENEKTNVTVEIKKSCFQYHLYKNHTTGDLFMDSEQLYGELLTPKLTGLAKNMKYFRHLNPNQRIAQHILSIAVTSEIDHMDEMSETVKKIKNHINSFDVPDYLIPWFVYRNVWEATRDFMKDRMLVKDYSFHEISGGLTPFKIHANAQIMILEMEDGKKWLFDYTQTLMLSDTIGSRYISLLYLHLEEILDVTPLPSPSELLQLYAWGDSILVERGNQAYDILKQLEPISISVLLNKWEDMMLSKEFFLQLYDSEEDHYSKTMMKRLFELLDKIGDHPNKVLELFGCYRHFGNPTVDELAGIESLKENSRAEIPLNDLILRKVSGAFNRMFILSFIEKKRRWPKCTCRDGSQYDNLVKLVQNRPTTLSEILTHHQCNDYYY